MIVNNPINSQVRNEQLQEQQVQSNQAEVKKNYWKSGFLASLLLWLLFMVVLVAYFDKKVSKSSEKVSADGVEQSKIKQPDYQENYVNKTYNFRFELQPFEEQDKYKEWNASYSFDYVEKFDTLLRIYRINQDAVTNKISTSLREKYIIYEVDGDVKDNLVSWREQNIKKAEASSGEYEITTFSELPCINNETPEIQENPVLIVISSEGVRQHGFYYIYFDFGKPFVLGYEPSWDMACDIRFPIDTITRLNSQ